MIPVYVSNGALITRYNGRDYHLLPGLVRQLDADGVEFLMYESWADQVSDIRRFLCAEKLDFPVVHADKKIGDLLSEFGAEAAGEAKALLERDACTADALGAKKLVVHLWNGPFSDSRFSDALPVIDGFLQIASRRGLLLTIENVTCRENRSLDHLCEMAARYPALRFTYDTKMAVLHGENLLLEKEPYRFLMQQGLISHLHLNDSRIDGGTRLPILHIGQGIVDFERFFRFAADCGFSGTATVESTSVNTDGTVNLDRLNESLRRIRAGLNPRSQK